MQLDPEPGSLSCADCGEPVADSGYLPAVAVSEETYQPVPDRAVCGACGFNELGFAGCAPELGDVVGDVVADDTVEADRLLQISVSAAGIDVLSAKE